MRINKRLKVETKNRAIIRYPKSKKRPTERLNPYKKGYRDGFYDGGDGIVTSNMPLYKILPDTSIQEIIAAGIQHLQDKGFQLKTAEEVSTQLIDALNTNSPYSLVRLGDGELLSLAQEKVLPISTVKAQTFLKRAGILIPDLKARDQLMESVLKANMVGIPISRAWSYQPLAMAVFQANQMDYKDLPLTDSFINYYLYDSGHLEQIWAKRRILLVGNKAPSLYPFLVKRGVDVTGVISPVNGMLDIPRVMNLIRNAQFDLALVSAGIPAVIISEKIATELGKVAIDFGHMANKLVKAARKP